MTLTEQIITIAMVVLGTQITRFVMFMVFPAGKKTPSFMIYMGQYLPGAVFGLLVIYCLKDIKFTENYHYALPQLISVAVTVVVHLYKRQMMLSIAAGTACYMILIRTIFA